jgi:hypothetical protein
MLDGYVPPLLILGLAGLLVAPFVVFPRRALDWATAAGIMLVLVAATAALELRMGRPAAYARGPLRVWVGDVQSDQNSQQIADPYSFTHVVHGALFYGITALTLGPSQPALRAAIAIGIESAWEAVENTDMVIERYRKATVSLGYYGDSVVNSIADVLACLIGFLLAWRLPTRATVMWVAAVELVLALWIRDNLTLNVVMLVYPLQVIRQWQAGG